MEAQLWRFEKLTAVIAEGKAEPGQFRELLDDVTKLFESDPCLWVDLCGAELSEEEVKELESFLGEREEKKLEILFSHPTAKGADGKNAEEAQKRINSPDAGTLEQILKEDKRLGEARKELDELFEKTAAYLYKQLNMKRAEDAGPVTEIELNSLMPKYFRLNERAKALHKIFSSELDRLRDQMTVDGSESSALADLKKAEEAALAYIKSKGL